MILVTAMLFFATGSLENTVVAPESDGGATTRTYVRMTRANVGIRLDPDAYVARVGTNESGVVELKDVRATISTSDAAAGAAYFRTVRPAMLSLMLFTGVSGLLICDLFRRVFRQVANGESFTAANIKHVHRIGLLILVSTVAIALLEGWAGCSAAAFVREHVQVAGLKIDPKPESPGGGIGLTINDFVVNVSLTGIFAGLMILALGEAFRQGLQLKEDTELTV